MWNRNTHRKSGIYKITNLVNSKFYIGSAVYFKHRKGVHIYDLKNNRHGNIHLQRAWNKYGKKAFKFELIEECKKEILIEREQYYIDKLIPHYNICRTAHSQLGVKFFKHSRNKMSRSQKNLPQDIKDKRTEARNKVLQKPFLEFTKNMVFIKEWKSRKEYEIFHNKSCGNISQVLHRKRKSAYGSIFIFKHKTKKLSLVN